MRKFWPLMANFWGFGAFALFVPLLVPLYLDLGFSAYQVGVLVGLPPVITIFGAPLWTNLADRTGRHQMIWTGLFVGAIATVVLLARVEAFFAVLAVLVAFYIVFSPFMSFIDTATMHMLGEEKDRYGRIRVGATVGFALFAWAGGIIAERSGVESALYAGAIVLVIAMLVVQRLDFGDTVQPADGGKFSMLRQAHWWLFIAVGFAGGIGFSLSAAYFYPFMGELGAVESVIGLAIFVGTISEVPVLFFGNRFLAAMKPFTLLVATVVFTGVRFVVMSFAGSVGVVMAIQATHGLTFVLMWVAEVAYADAHAPDGGKATAQGVFAASCTGAGAAVGGFAGGPILEGLGADTLFLAGGVAIIVIATIAGTAGIRSARREGAATV